MKEIDLNNVKGTFDYLPEEQLIRNKIINILKEVFELYGYLPIETTTICSRELLTSKYAGGKEIIKEIYSLTDQGKRELGLRYDLTVPFSKVLGREKMTLPFRRYEIGKVYRDGPVKVGRNREFYQCDVDVCGIKNVEAELEFFQMTIMAYQKLNIDIQISWNNRKFLSGLIKELNIDESLVSRTILSVDKLQKIGKEDVIKELEKEGVSRSITEELFTYFDKTIIELTDEFDNTNNVELKEGLEEINILNNYIINLKMDNICIFTPFLARGLEIYTGTIWEIFDKQKRITSSLGGGGRYDKIITKFINDGNIYPAIGMSFGLEPIYELCQQNKTFTNNNIYDVYIYSFELNEKVFEIANILRQNNVKTILELNKIKLKKGLDYANKNNIEYVIIIGEDELKNNTITLKNMILHTQEELTIEQFLKILNIR